MDKLDYKIDELLERCNNSEEYYLFIDECKEAYNDILDTLERFYNCIPTLSNLNYIQVLGYAYLNFSNPYCVLNDYARKNALSYGERKAYVILLIMFERGWTK